MELRQLRYFAAVAEELHFGRAAQRLGIVQSAVSQQIRRLERELGIELFDRGPRRVALTEAGRAFLPRARAVLAAEQQALATAAELAGDRRATLRLGTSSGLGARLDLFLDAVGRLAPGVRVQLVSAPAAARLSRVAAGELDAAFARGLEEAPPGVRLLPVWREPLLAALPARHPLARKAKRDEAGSLQLAELARIPLRLVARREHPALVDLVVEACAAAGFEPRPGPPTGSLQDTLAEIGANAAGWTVVYASHAAQLAHARIAFVPLLVPQDGAPRPLAITTVLAVREAVPQSLVRLLVKAGEAAGADLDS